jgi:hypothetical protein
MVYEMDIIGRSLHLMLKVMVTTGHDKLNYEMSAKTGMTRYDTLKIITPLH